MIKSRFIILFVCVIFQSCCFYCEDEGVNERSVYEPVYISRTDIGNSIQLKSPQSIVNSGKIYIIDNLLFIGEKRKGFHVFDNSNPLNPKKIKFIQALGSSDIAIRKNVMYINQATDLITLQFDFVNETLKLTKRVENTFPELASPDGRLANNIPEDSIVIDWKLKN